MCDNTPFESAVGFYYTRDLCRTATFWEQVVGLPLVLDQGTCRIYRVSQDGFIGFCERSESVNTSGVIITLVTPDVDGAVDGLRRRGLTFEKEPAFNHKYNIYHAFFRDPNGYLIEIQRFEDPAWPSKS